MRKITFMVLILSKDKIDKLRYKKNHLIQSASNK